jgi:transcriptional regulator with XRE-family HTH domain
MIESGVLKNPTMDALRRLAKLLDVKVTDLLE